MHMLAKSHVQTVAVWMFLLATSPVTAGDETSDANIEELRYPTSASGELPTADGFRGIWYANQPSGDEYVYKYSGGKATYPHQHTPIAIYAPQVDKTFFVYGGSYQDRNALLHMISYYDHATGMVARPRVLLDKQTGDAHDNPTLCIGPQGYLYVFSSAHGTSRPAFIHRSTRPYDITSFECILEKNFSYTQPWYLGAHGFVFMHTRYQGARVLYVMQSDDAIDWLAPQKLAKIDEGHYQVTQPCGDSIGSAFNYHPAGRGLNSRTNLYYITSSDGGHTWTNVAGEELTTPLTEVDNPALVTNYETEGLNCYMKCLRYTPDGRPIILHLTSGGYESGPQNDPRTFRTATWTGKEWTIRDAMLGDNNYDYAFLDVLDNGDWQITGTTQPGPQRFNTGGEMAIWRSSDEGRTWTMTKQLTTGSPYNHCYPRQVFAGRDDFYALWADGHGRKKSDSRLYFTDREGSAVWQLPPRIEGDASMVKPRVWHGD